MNTETGIWDIGATSDYHIAMLDAEPLPSDMLAHALHMEQQERKARVMSYVHQGHVAIEYDNNPAHICVRIEDELLSDARERFPSITLMARVELAIAAGLSHRKVKQKNDHQVDAFSYAAQGSSYNTPRRGQRHIWMTYDELKDQF